MKVRCIDDSNSWGELVVGEVCEVEKEYPGVYKLVNGGQWNKNRFEIVEEDEGMTGVVKECETCGNFERVNSYNTKCLIGCFHNCQMDMWKPKEPVAEEKGTVSRGKMMDMLMENPTLRAECKTQSIPDIVEYQERNKCFHSLNGHFDWRLADKNERWTIIEPPKQLKKMKIQEMAKYYSNEVYGENISSNDIKSVVTGKSINATGGFAGLTETEIDGLFTVEGVYEDET